MSSTENQVVIITGASSGIGEAAARELAGRGLRLMLAARRSDRLQQLASELSGDDQQVRFCETDVTRREDLDNLVQQTLDAYGRVDVLVNNAGLMPLSPIAKLKVDEWDRMIDVNIKGVLYGIAAVMPTMQKQGAGHIINLSSVAGHRVFPGAAVYCATKFAVRALSEGLRQESDGKIRSTIISPGAVATELTDHISDQETKDNIDQIVKIAIDPSAIARAIAFAIEQPADVDVNEILIRPTKQEL